MNEMMLPSSQTAAYGGVVGWRGEGGWWVVDWQGSWESAHNYRVAREHNGTLDLTLGLLPARFPPEHRFGEGAVSNGSFDKNR